MNASSALTVAEVAALVRKNQDTVRRWVRGGYLRAIKTPGGYLITRAELARALPGVCEVETPAGRKRRADAAMAEIDRL